MAHTTPYVLSDLITFPKVLHRSRVRDAVLVLGGALFTALCAQVVVHLGFTPVPLYASATGGWERATGSTFGYFIGFVLASGIVGWFADRRNDRNYITSLSSLVFASSIIYACGAVWLSHSLNIPLAQGEGSAIELGVSPFLVGDAIKIALAATVAPLGWAAYYSRPR